MKKENETNHSWQRTALAVLCVVLAIILLFLLMGVFYVHNRLSLIRHTGTGTAETLSSEQIESILSATDVPGETAWSEVDPTDISWATEPATEPVEQNDKIINILLIGQDRRPEESRARSDAMILCTINTEARTLTMTSFMRDLYVQIPGYMDNRINVSYAVGGMDLLDACLEKNFGVRVDGNVEVDFDGFTEIIDLLGGVDIELNAAEVEYMKKADSASDGLKVGVNHLNGSQALTYSRIRYVGNNDFERTSRQRRVLNALLQKCKGLDVWQLDRLLVKVLPLLTTDLSSSQILAYAAEILPILSDLTVVNQRVPEDGAYQGASVRGMSVLIPDLEKIRNQLKQTIGAV